jgi:hypothetical protein
VETGSNNITPTKGAGEFIPQILSLCNAETGSKSIASTSEQFAHIPPLRVSEIVSNGLALTGWPHISLLCKAEIDFEEAMEAETSGLEALYQCVKDAM